MPQPDHIVVIMTDQQRADMCAREGFGVDCMPAMDALAEQGCWFDRAYTSAPLCVPARISLLTGRYPSAHGIRENPMSDPPRYDADLIDVMGTAGYRTAMIGKNHSHLSADRVDRFVEYGHLGRTPAGADAKHAEHDAWLHEVGFEVSMTVNPFPVEEQMPARLVNQAVDWLDENRDARSFLWLSIPEPHIPFQVSEPYFSDYSPEMVPPPDTSAEGLKGKGFVWQHLLERARLRGEDQREVLLRARASYVGSIRMIDDQLARLFAHLRDTGLFDRTLVVFLADHGDFAGDYGLLRKGGELCEVLTRIPMVFAGAGIKPGVGRSPAHVSIVDVLPTLCELVEQPIPAGVQGRSLVGVLRDEDVPEQEFASVYAEQGFGGLAYDAADLDRDGGNQYRENGEVYPPLGVGNLDGVVMSGSRRMVRSGRWKLVADEKGRLELYDLDVDPYELSNLAGHPEHAAELFRLTRLLMMWLTRTADTLPVPGGGFRRKRHPRNYNWHEA